MLVQTAQTVRGEAVPSVDQQPLRDGKRALECLHHRSGALAATQFEQGWHLNLATDRPESS